MMDNISGDLWKNFIVPVFLIAVAGVAIAGATVVYIATYLFF